MREPIRIALIQLPWSGSIETMQAGYQDLILQASNQGAQLVCLPELSLNPYFPGTRSQTGFELVESIPGGLSEEFFKEMAFRHRVTLIGSVYEQATDGCLYDTVTTHSPKGELLGITRKIHIPSGPGYHETDFFAGASSYPVFDIGFLKIATPTCYDQWFPELARIYALNGADLIIYPTAIGDDLTDREIDYSSAWETIMRSHAIANGVFVAAINRVGTENGVTFYGKSFVCDPMGTILARAGTATSELVIADLSPEMMIRWRGLFPLLHQRRPETYTEILKKWDGDNPPTWMENTPTRRVKP